MGLATSCMVRNRRIRSEYENEIYLNKPSDSDDNSLEEYDIEYYEETKCAFKRRMVQALNWRREDWIRSYGGELVDNLIFLEFICNWKKNSIPLEVIYADEDIFEDLPELFIKLINVCLLSEEVYIYPLWDFGIFLQKGTSVSSEFGRLLYDQQCVEFLIKTVLPHHKLAIGSFEDDVEPCGFLIILFYIRAIHNIVMLHDDLRMPVRDIGALDEISKKLDPLKRINYDNSDELKLFEAISKMTLSYLIKEGEDDRFLTNANSLCFILKNLIEIEKSSHYNALSKDEKLIKESFYIEADEILFSINQIAQNEKYDELFSELIPALYRFIKDTTKIRDKKLALDCLWTLSFYENSKKVFKSQKLCEKLHKISRKASNVTVQKSAERIVRELSKKNRASESSSLSKHNGSLTY
ncbi:unnamed protein product [Dimorphilus gyrociliatus]|uniref:Uncharacterized protein n=1 Tax=Dimorphilus gyrociliatus TaxID=2664684 RepID=A0A7I8VV05_9ANNE|nr:unnamed protein product [Dimorphilus gyrociliatus]